MPKADSTPTPAPISSPLTLFMSLSVLECLRVVVTHDVVDLLVLPRVHDLGQDGAHLNPDDELLVNVGELHGRTALDRDVHDHSALLRSVVVRVLPSDLRSEEHTSELQSRPHL